MSTEKKTKIAIVGSNGFIASNFSKRLRELPNVELLLCGSSPHNISGFQDIYKVIDLFDEQVILSYFKDIDIIYYFKSATIPSSSWENPLIEIQNNLIPFLTFLNTISKLNIKKLVFISSGGAIYGETSNSISEDFDKEPISPYGITKLTIEHYLNYYYKKYNLHYDILRVSNVYGYWPFSLRKFGLINTYLNEIEDNSTISVFGDGGIIRDYIYITDLVNILLRLLDNIDVEKNRVLNVSSGDCFTINEIIKAIQCVVQIRFNVEYTNSRSSDVRSIRLNNQKLLELIGPLDFTPIKIGIAETYKYIKHADRIK